jgi:cytochrome c553
MHGLSPLASPLPLAGEGQGGGSFFGSSFAASPSPTLPRKRGSECAVFAATLLAVFLHMLPALAAGDIKAGRQKALVCQTCHGIDGLSKIPEAPNIAGSPEQYLARQLNAFRKGERKNEMMSVVAQQLSDKDVDDLAAYYSAIEVTVTLPK